jgi:TonB-linked SusC/RagA family outer membrane protein
MGSGSSGPWNSGSGITETQVGSNNLRWEKAVKQNLGIDMKLFGEHIDLSVDFYKDVRSGIYQQRASIPAEMGLASMPYANVGKMKSWGVDGHISYFQPLGKDAGLTLRANLTQSKNKVLEFEESIKSYPYQYTTGYTWGIQRGLVALGLFKDEEEIRNSPRQTFASDVLPGDIKYKDVNGDGVVNWDDQIPLKYSNVPEIQYGFATEVYWKNWTLSVLFGGVSHVQYYAGGSGYVPFENKETGNILKIVADQNNRWTSAAFSGDPSTERADAKFPRLSYGSNANSQVYSTFWLRNGAYLRLKNVQLTYNLDKSLVKKLYMTNASISLIGENLALWDHGDKIFDPSQASGNGAAYPLQRVFTLQINVSF